MLLANSEIKVHQFKKRLQQNAKLFKKLHAYLDFCKEKTL
jgi:hypothetical protein